MSKRVDFRSWLLSVQARHSHPKIRLMLSSGDKLRAPLLAIGDDYIVVADPTVAGTNDARSLVVPIGAIVGATDVSEDATNPIYPSYGGRSEVPSEEADERSPAPNEGGQAHEQTVEGDGGSVGAEGAGRVVAAQEPGE